LLAVPRQEDASVKILGQIALGCLNGAERLAPSAVRLGERFARFSNWVEDRRTRLAIFSVLAD
jgi:predicted dienelactone hydrolase